MGLLSKPSKATSYQSWQDIGGSDTVLVQRRTESGLAKNRSAAHRIAFGATELFPFRIIVLSGRCAGLGYDPQSPGATHDHEGDLRMKDATRHIIAAGQSKIEILKDWDDLRSFTDTSALAADAWEATYRQVQYQKRSALGSDAGSMVTATRSALGASASRSPLSSMPSDSQARSPTRTSTSRNFAAADSTGSSASPKETRAMSPSTESEKFVEAEQPPSAAADAPKSPVQSPTYAKDRLRASLEAEAGPKEAAITPSEVWLLRMARLWDGSAPVAAIATVLLMLLSTTCDANSLAVTLGLPVVIGSLLPLDSATDQTAERRDRLAHYLRGHPAIAFLSQRQSVANLVSSTVVCFFAVSALGGPAAMEVLDAACATLMATAITVATVWGLLSESRTAWHARVELAERNAMRASNDATTFFPSADPSVPRRAASSDALADNGQTFRAASPDPAKPGAASMLPDELEPCMDLIDVPDLPPTVAKCLDFVQQTTWSSASKSSGTTIQTGTVPWCNAPATLFKTQFPGVRAMSVYRTLYDDPAGVKGRRSLAFQIEQTLNDRYLIKRVGRNEAYWYTSANSKFPGIAGRDFTNLVAPFTLLSKETCAKYQLDDAPGFMYCAEWYNGDGVPALNPPFVRGRMYRYIIIAQDSRDGSGVNLTVAISLDPCGNIPAFTVPIVNRDTASKFRRLEMFVRNYERAHGKPDVLPFGEALHLAKEDDTAAEAAAQEEGTPVTSRPTPAPLKMALELINEPGWIKKPGEHGCTWETKKVSYSATMPCLNRCFWQGIHAANLAKYLDDDPDFKTGKSLAYEFDPLLESRTRVGSDPEDDRMFRASIKFKTPGMFIGPREFCMRMLTRYFMTDEEKKKYRIGHVGHDAVVQASFDDPTQQHSRSFTRGSTRVFAIICADRPDGSGVDVTQLVFSELGGSIPSSFINFLDKTHMAKLDKQREKFLQLEKAEGRLPPVGVAGQGGDGRATAQQQQQPDAKAAAAAEAKKADEGAAAAAAPTVDPSGLVEIPKWTPREGALPDVFAKAAALWRKTDWKPHSSKDGASMKSMPSPYCNKQALWVTTSVPGATLLDFDAAINDDREGLRGKDAPYKYDSLLDKKETIDVDEEDRCMTLHSMFLSPSRLIAPRDTVTKLYWREPLDEKHLNYFDDILQSETGRVLACVGVESDKSPVKSPYVRGHTHIFSLWGVEQRDRVDLHIVMSFDPCGSVPSSLVNTANSAQLDKIILMRQLTLAAAERNKHERAALARRASVKAAPAAESDAAAAKPSTDLIVVPKWEPRSGVLPDSFAKAAGLWRRQDWKPHASKDGASMKSMPSPFCNKQALWVTTSVPGATLLDFDAAINDDREGLRGKDAPYKYDSLLDKKETIGVDDEDRCMTLHSMFKSPSRLIAPRDTVANLYWREPLSGDQLRDFEDLFTSETGRVLACVGVESDKSPVKSPYVRGHTHIFSLWGVEQRDRVDLHIVMSFDPCGSVPSSLVNTANSAQLDKIISMRKLVLEAMSQRKGSA